MGMVYWLWSENAFLRYKAEHPGFVRESGPLTEELSDLLDWTSLIVVAGSILGSIAYHWFRRRRWRRRPIPVAILILYGETGAAVTVIGLYAIARAIDAYVWESHCFWFELLTFFTTIYIGIIAFAHAVQEYGFCAFALKDEVELSAEQLEEARRLILDKKEIAAQRYCQQVAASKQAGREIFYNLRDTLCEQYPEKFPERTVGGRISRGCLFWVLVSLGVIIIIFIILAFS